MPGPIARTYKNGSIIYFEGDKNNEIYILKAGRVVLTSTSVESGEEIHEDLRPGEFFGVKSSLGHYPREETAQTLTDSVVLVLQASDFELLMSKNIRLVMKMLRVFSNQLRNIGKNVRQILGETELKKPSTELLKLAEYFYQQKKVEYAKYAYSKYIQDFPTSKFVERAKSMFQHIEGGQPYPGKFAELDSDEFEEEIPAPQPLSDFQIDEGLKQDSMVNTSDEMSLNGDNENIRDQREETPISDQKDNPKKGIDSDPLIDLKMGKQEFQGSFKLVSSDIEFN